MQPSSIERTAEENDRRMDDVGSPEVIELSYARRLNPKEFKSYFRLAIIALVLFLPAGIVGVIFSKRAKGCEAIGQPILADTYARYSRIASMIGIIIGLIAIAITISLFLLAENPPYPVYPYPLF